MQKTINILFALLLTGALVLLGIQFKSAKKLAYIDTARLMEKSVRMKQLRETLQKKASENQARVDTLTKQFEDALKMHEKQVPSMSPKERQLAEELLRNKQNQMAQYQQAVRQQLMQEEQKANQEELKSINSVITEYGKKKGYDLILATTNGNIAYANEGIEITEDIVQLVNQR